jgi:2-methylisocitrate lyase-like PEP mutase family enzyme
MFLMPDAWRPKSARMLEAAGFPAIGTTRSGLAQSLGVVERQGCITLRQTVDAIAGIGSGIDVPLSVDFEAGFGATPDDVAEMIWRTIHAGAVGGTIPDQSGVAGQPLFDTHEAVERIAAAREAADHTKIKFTLTARTNCFLTGMEAPFAATVRRANLYREAGADCLFVPGVNNLGTIASLAREIDAPLGVALGGQSFGFVLADLKNAGVKRVSLGGYLPARRWAYPQGGEGDVGRVLSISPWTIWEWHAVAAFHQPVEHGVSDAALSGRHGAPAVRLPAGIVHDRAGDESAFRGRSVFAHAAAAWRDPCLRPVRRHQPAAL